MLNLLDLDGKAFGVDFKGSIFDFESWFVWDMTSFSRVKVVFVIDAKKLGRADRFKSLKVILAKILNHPI